MSCDPKNTTSDDKMSPFRFTCVGYITFPGLRYHSHAFFFGHRVLLAFVLSSQGIRGGLNGWI